ncbi:MAG: peptidoglycan-binding protein [Magnetococcales bacterium]|nr:peptidoglycan-binding protein [Magnetococcales bacterium]
MVTDLQKQTCQAIVNIFETGKIGGDYGQVTLLKGDSGHLTYGRSQTTLASGNLYLLIKSYCDAQHALLAEAMQPYLERLADKDLSLDNDMNLRGLLKEAGEDPVMHGVQDAFFDRVYWDVAVKNAAFLGSKLPLSLAIVYDSQVHGAWPMIRDRTLTRFGMPEDSIAPDYEGERIWFTKYVQTRKDWLTNQPNTLLRRTVYRMNAFQALIDQEKWTLDLPVTVRGLEINADVLGMIHPIVLASAENHANTPRLLRLKNPMLQGADVQKLQNLLQANGVTVKRNGEFDQATEQAVKQFQQAHALKVDGVVGSLTWAALGD